MFFILFYVVADFQLVVDKVFGLCKTADKLFSFFAPQPANPALLDDFSHF